MYFENVYYHVLKKSLCKSNIHGVFQKCSPFTTKIFIVFIENDHYVLKTISSGILNFPSCINNGIVLLKWYIVHSKNIPCILKICSTCI